MVVLSGPLVDGVVGVADGLDQPAGRALGERGLERVDSRLRRHLAAAVTAHAVGHGEEAVLGDEAVLVRRPDLADVGDRSGPHDHRVTSSTVLPTCSRSPRRTATGPVTFLRLR